MNKRSTHGNVLEIGAMALDRKIIRNEELFFSENLVCLKVAYMKNRKILWISKKWVHRYDEFLERFSFGIPGNELFDEIDFDLGITKDAYAERYGGLGVVDNGGGVRCVNDGVFQIKGSGKNMLSGAGKDKWHSYGGLNAIDAVYEATMSQVLKNVLPVGVAEYYGVIYTGEKTAYNYGEKIGHGALLIRERCLRPAHFLRSPQYKPNNEFKDKVPSDLYRVRRVTKKLLQYFPETDELISFIENFILRAANQFSFSKAARISWLCWPIKSIL